MWLSIVQFVLVLAGLILLHELGHYLAAKWLGIEVEEFGIGFPPRIMRLFRAWDTDFTLNWLPFGGFVRAKGEEDPDAPGGLFTAPAWKRVLFYLAGPTMNLLIGVVLYIVIFLRLGAAPMADKVLITDVAPDSPAAQAGLQAGDLVLTMNGQTIHSIEQLIHLTQAHLGQQVTLTVQRNTETLTVSLTPRVNPPPGEGAIGILLTNPLESITWYQAIPLGVGATGVHLKMLLSIPVRLIREGQSEDFRLLGYKGMYDLYQNARAADAQPDNPTSGVNLLSFITAITLSLAVLNLFPIPALDGGRILFTLPELLTGYRVPARFEVVVNFVGFMLLLWAMFYINLQDFINPVHLP